jgi:transposase
MDYSRHITQSVDELRLVEARQKLARNRDRIRFVRLLKEGQAATQRQAGQAIGIALRQSQRLWQTYCQGGLKALIEPTHQPGFGKLSAYQLSQLQTWLRLDEAQTLEQIQGYIWQRWAVEYTLSGLCKLCQRLKIKAKTGRPVNRRQDPAALETFKKTFAS